MERQLRLVFNDTFFKLCIYLSNLMYASFVVLLPSSSGDTPPYDAWLATYCPSGGYYKNTVCIIHDVLVYTRLPADVISTHHMFSITHKVCTRLYCVWFWLDHPYIIDWRVVLPIYGRFPDNNAVNWKHVGKWIHYSDVIVGTMASQITSLTIVCPTVYSGAYQTKHQSSASLAFVRGIHRWPVNSPHKRPVSRKIFSFFFLQNWT